MDIKRVLADKDKLVLGNGIGKTTLAKYFTTPSYQNRKEKTMNYTIYV